MMAFKYLDNIADAGIRASGKTLSEVFCEAARGMFNLMADLDLVKPQRAVKITVYAKTLDLLLVEWLSRLLIEKDLTGLVFAQFSARIEKREDKIVLTGVARGEVFDALRHEARTEVKGVTYAGLRVWQEEGRFLVRCVVDV